MTEALIVVDDKLPDTASRYMSAAVSLHSRARVETLSAYLLSRGLEFDRRTGTLGWPSGGPLPQADVGIVYNRVVEVSPETASAFLTREWDSIPTNFVWSAYARALESVPRVVGASHGIGSPAGNLLPLNLQWKAVSEHLHDVQTPRFGYGMGAAPVDTTNFRLPIRKRLFDIYNWTEPYSPTRMEMHEFVVDRPAGDAVMLYFVGDESSVFPLDDKIMLSASTLTRLLSYTTGIRAAFKAFIGEALFFVDQERITFAAFSHHLGTSVNHAALTEVMERGLASSDVYSAYALNHL